MKTIIKKNICEENNEDEIFNENKLKNIKNTTAEE